MRTVICQSYRTDNVPLWMRTCMKSVKDWASTRGYHYEFMDDTFFDLVPEWYRKKVKESVYLVSDLARLVLLNKMLTAGYERAVWVDADVLIFDPHGFEVSIEAEYAFTRENYISVEEPRTRQESGNAVGATVRVAQRVTNSFVVFAKGNHFLDFYIHAAQQMVSDMNPNALNVFAIGTNWLTMLAGHLNIPLVDGVGLIHPRVVEELAATPGRLVRLTSALYGEPLLAANLCASLVTEQHVVAHWDPLYERVVDRLLSTHGGVFNNV